MLDIVLENRDAGGKCIADEMAKASTELEISDMFQGICIPIASQSFCQKTVERNSP